jgi:hypothetical protein
MSDFGFEKAEFGCLNADFYLSYLAEFLFF